MYIHTCKTFLLRQNLLHSYIYIDMLDYILTPNRKVINEHLVPICALHGIQERLKCESKSVGLYNGCISI